MEEILGALFIGVVLVVLVIAATRAGSRRVKGGGLELPPIRRMVRKMR